MGFMSSLLPGVPVWNDLERIRRGWQGNLIVKGLLHPDDASRAVDLGADGIIVSNHGGRQFDRTPSPLLVFPAIRDAVGGRTTLMLDSGIRRGGDIVIALCLGAKFAFTGRATLYGLAAGGQAGVRRAIAILRDEIEGTARQMGCQQTADFDLSRLYFPETT